LRAQGWIVVQALDAGTGAVEDARRLGCTHVYADGTVHPLAVVGETR
jgi:hypothetical protein